MNDEVGEWQSQWEGYDLHAKRVWDMIEKSILEGTKDSIFKPVNSEAARIAIEKFLRTFQEKGEIGQHPMLGIGPVVMAARARACVDWIWGYRVVSGDLPDDRVRLILLDDMRVADEQPGVAEGKVVMEMAYRELAEFEVRWPETGDPVALVLHTWEGEAP